MGGGVDGAAPLDHRIKSAARLRVRGREATGEESSTGGVHPHDKGFEHSRECKQLAKTRKRAEDNSHY